MVAKKPSKPLLTVLMPVYNAGKFLTESIGSILKQTYYNFELLILDDGSTDNSLKIIKAYAKEDTRIKVLVNKINQGEAKCRNLLLKNTKTEFVAWMDADDISLEDRLQLQMDFLKQNPDTDAVGIQHITFGNSGNLPTNFTSHYSRSDLEIKTNFIFGYDFLLPSSLMRMKKIKQHNLFFDINYKLSTGVDQQYIIDCFPFMKFANLDRVLYQYRQHHNQITKINQKQIIDNASVIIRKHLLKFNIKADSETIHFFLRWINEGLAYQKFPETVKIFDKLFFIKKDFDIQKFQKVLGLLIQLVTIKNFYNHSRIEKSFFTPHYLALMMYFYQLPYWKRNRETISELFRDILKQYPDAESRMFLKKIYCSYCDTGLEGKLFFLKDFGFLDDAKPLLTVLMPVYNAEKFLDESIGSILNQTYVDFEFLVLDDGSIDNSLKIIKAYAKEDKRIKVLVNQKKQQEAKCRNLLLQNSKTEFIAWMDADDISLEDRLQLQMDFLNQNPDTDAVGIQYSAFGSSGNLTTNHTSRNSLSDIEIKTGFIFGYDFFFPSSLMRIKKIKQHNLFFDINYKLSTGVDQQYIIDCFPFMKFANLKEVLYQYRQHHNQITTINQKQILDNSSVIIRTHLLKFNIKADIDTIHFFLEWIDNVLINQKFTETVKIFDKLFFIKKDFDIQKFQKVLGLLIQLVAIKNFYNHSRIEKSFFIPHCLALMMYFYQLPYWKRNRETISELFRDILKQYPDAESRMFLKKIYCHYRDSKLEGELFFLKDFGFLDDSKPLLTVLMPVYNAEKFLAESIGSVLKQTYYNFELLILDDTSTDNSLKIIKDYAKEDKRIKVLVNNANQKTAKSRNILLKKATTEFIAWMDADDISLPHWLQTQMDFLKQNPNIDVVSCHLQFFGGREFILKKHLLDSQIKSTFLLDCAFGTGGSMIKMEKIRANELFFNEQLESAEDYDYWVKSCSVLSFAATDEILYNCRAHNKQESENNKEKQRKIHLLTVQRHLLQFNIKTDIETIRIFFNWDRKRVEPKKFQEAIEIFNKIFALKYFYGYSSIEKSTFMHYYLNLLRYLCSSRLLEKNNKKVKKFLKNILKEYPDITPSFLLKEIHYNYKVSGLKGELFFLKDFGFLNDFKPLLTVLMPVYNEEKFLAESIGSILNQTYYNFELLILDDASTDNSLKIINAYAKEDKRIKVLINKTNQKQAKCRNLLLKNSKTEFIAWMDADDISLEDRLQTQMDYLNQNPDTDAVGIQYSAFGSSVNLPADLSYRGSLSDIEIKTGFIFGHDFLFGGSLMRMKKIKQHNLFFDNNYKLSTGEDHQYILDCFPFMKFANIDKVLYQYRQDSNQTTAINQKLDNAGIITKKHLLKFNIKTDLETIKMFLKWNDGEFDSQASQKFQEAIRVFEEIFTIKDFYGYSGVEKFPLIRGFFNLLSCLRYSGLLKKNREIFKKFFETISRQCSVTCSTMFLKKIYYHYRDTGLKGELFFIKDFGFLNDFKPLLTVLMPVYNEEKFLAESIGSILNQTYYNFELLILDDASTDNSFKIIKAYAKEDKRIKVLVNKTNKKQAKCRNRLLKNTKTEFIAWMDADDISLEDRLQNQMDFLKQNSNIDAVGIQYSAFGSSVNLPADLISHYSLSDLEIKTNFIFGYDFLFGGSLMRMKKIKQHNIFFYNNYKLSTGEDQQYIIDCFSFMKFANIDKVLYQYRQDSNQTTAINQKQILNNACVIISNHLLKFNIKADLETIKIFLQWNDDVVSHQTSQKFQEAVRVFEDIFTIKDFYGYSDIKKSPLIRSFLNLLSCLRYSGLLKKNREIFKNFFEALSRQCSVADSTIFLKKIYYRYCNTGLEGESFFIKDFGFLDGFKPILTVLMPVYNEEQFLVESIGSILDQNYYNFELLILDDGSTDNSLKIIKDYAKEDKRIKILVNKTNQGEAKCRNRLIKNSKTEFIAWMDADDISLEDRLQNQMDFLKQNSNIDAVGTQYSALGSNVNLPADFISHFSLSDLEIKTGFILGYDFLFPSSLMRMKKIKQHNIFFDNNYKLSTGADHQYIIDCFYFMKFANLDKVLYQYRQDSNQTTAINQKQILNNASVIIRKHLLKFNIKADLETVKIFLKCNDVEVSSHTSQKFLEIVKVFDKIFFIKRKFDIQKFQKVLKVLCQLTAIKNFYDYARTEKSFFIPHCLALVMYFYQIPSYKKDRETISELFRDILKQYPDVESRMFLKKIYSHCRDGGLEEKLFFIKDFGIKNYFKIKTW